MKNLPKYNCPKCGFDYDPDEDEIIECPRCHKQGSTACCNSAGRGCLCIDCEESGRG